MRRKIEAEVRAKLTDDFPANFLLGNDEELLRFGVGGSVQLSDGWQETLNRAIDREIDAAKRIAEKQIDTTVRNRVANSQPRQVSSEDLVRGQVDRTLVRTALQRESREIDQRLHQVWNDDTPGRTTRERSSRLRYDFRFPIGAEPIGHSVTLSTHGFRDPVYQGRLKPGK
jgi:hypothetical protein